MPYGGHCRPRSATSFLVDPDLCTLVQKTLKRRSRVLPTAPIQVVILALTSWFD